MTGVSRELSKEEYKEFRKNQVLEVVKAHPAGATFQDFMELIGFEFKGSIITAPQVLYGYLKAPTEEELDLLYYEVLVVHPEFNLPLVCFYASQGSGTFGFELTEENWNAHIQKLKSAAETEA